jgi:hypothetical protein
MEANVLQFFIFLLTKNWSFSLIKYPDLIVRMKNKRPFDESVTSNVNCKRVTNHKDMLYVYIFVHFFYKSIFISVGKKKMHDRYKRDVTKSFLKMFVLEIK